MAMDGHPNLTCAAIPACVGSWIVFLCIELFYIMSNPQELNVRDRSNKASGTKAEAARQHEETYKIYSMSTRAMQRRLMWRSRGSAQRVETVDTASKSGLSRKHMCEVDEMQARWQGCACEVNWQCRARGTRAAGTMTPTSCGVAGTWWAEHKGVNMDASTEGTRAPEMKMAGTGMPSMRIGAPCTRQPSDVHAGRQMCARNIEDVHDIGSDGSSSVRMSGSGGSACFGSVMYHMWGVRRAWRAVHLHMKSAICVDIYILLWDQVNCQVVNA
ncbi:hypothetical protein OBBRIDRAFT_808531 [Obba rivulosa]|uniref:Uncharacterized protein n=1 Tax=Obba rivulosa TaxID=1052685 RepID=A0A8E2ART6_9APHY|nr:hypothetical protein OBBRIDRAFT_808531 [Obba rivulosa]